MLTRCKYRQKKSRGGLGSVIKPSHQITTSEKGFRVVTDDNVALRTVTAPALWLGRSNFLDVVVYLKL